MPVVFESGAKHSIAANQYNHKIQTRINANTERFIPLKLIQLFRFVFRAVFFFATQKLIRIMNSTNPMIWFFSASIFRVCHEHFQVDWIHIEVSLEAIILTDINLTTFSKLNSKEREGKATFWKKPLLLIFDTWIKTPVLRWTNSPCNSDKTITQSCWIISNYIPFFQRLWIGWFLWPHVENRYEFATISKVNFRHHC